MSLCVCIYQHVYVSFYRGQSRVAELLQLELQAALNCPTSLLGGELRYSESAISALTAEPSLPTIEIVIIWTMISC